MFLDTAQERDSILAHIKELNYVPRSVHSAVAYVNIEIQPDDAPSSISIPKWTIFNSTVDGKSLKFSTQEDLIIKPTVNTTSNTTTYAVSNVAIYEGAIVEEYAIADNSNNFTVDISNKNIDTRHLVVSVKDSTTAANSTYSDWEKKETLFGINATSNVYFTEPQIGDKFKLTFGDGIFGKKPVYDTISFFDQEAGRTRSPSRWILPETITSRNILKDLESVGIAKKLAKKPDELGMRALVGAHVLSTQTWIYRPSEDRVIRQ